MIIYLPRWSFNILLQTSRVMTVCRIVLLICLYQRLYTGWNVRLLPSNVAKVIGYIAIELSALSLLTSSLCRHRRSVGTSKTIFLWHIYIWALLTFWQSLRFSASLSVVSDLWIVSWCVTRAPPDGILQFTVSLSFRLYCHGMLHVGRLLQITIVKFVALSLAFLRFLYDNLPHQASVFIPRLSIRRQVWRGEHADGTAWWALRHLSAVRRRLPHRRQPGEETELRAGRDGVATRLWMEVGRGDLEGRWVGFWVWNAAHVSSLC